MSSSWWANKMGNPQPAAPPAYRPAPPVTQRPPAYQPPPQPQQRQQDIQVTVENTFDAAMQWSGGEAARTESSNCPMCGSDLFFSRANSAAVVSQNGSAKVPPRCYSCGYTEGREMQGVPNA
jgi:hypothetical protein